MRPAQIAEREAVDERDSSVEILARAREPVHDGLRIERFAWTSLGRRLTAQGTIDDAASVHHVVERSEERGRLGFAPRVPGCDGLLPELEGESNDSLLSLS